MFSAVGLLKIYAFILLFSFDKKHQNHLELCGTMSLQIWTVSVVMVPKLKWKVFYNFKARRDEVCTL